MYGVLGPLNSLVILVAGNILLWKKNIELLIDAVRSAKTIEQAQEAQISANHNALLKLQKAYNMTGEELAYWIREHKLAPSVLERMKKKTDEATTSTKENTEATEENTEATDENVESKVRWLTASELVEAEIMNLTAQFELSNKTTEETAKYYSQMIEKHEELIEKLKEERQSHQEGTVEYQNYTSAIYAAEIKIKELTTATRELYEIESKVLTGLDLVTAELGVLENKYSDVAKDEEYFTEKAKLLKQEYEMLNAKLKETEFHSEEWFKLTNQLLDNEEATRNLKEEWDEFNTVQSNALTGVELVNAELILLEARYENLAKDQDYVTQKTALLNEKYRLLNQALAESEFHSAEWFELKQNIIAVENELGELSNAVSTTEQRWIDFFAELKAKYSDAIGAIQTGISNFVSSFENAISDAIYSLFTMAETNAEIQDEIAQAEQDRLDELEQANEDYKQALIEKLSEYVDAKILQNATIEELETMLKEYSMTEWASMSEYAQQQIQAINDKYDELTGDLEEKQVTVGSILKNLWKALVDAIIQELARIAAYYVVSWVLGIFGLGEGGGIGYKLGGLVKNYSFGGAIRNAQQSQEVEYFQAGGRKTTDTVPAMLTPGEYVISKPMVDFIKRTGAVTADLIKSIRVGSPTPTPSFANGGLVGTGNIGGAVELNIMPGAININAKSLDDRAISEAGTKLFAEIEKQARNAGVALLGR